MDWKGRDQRPGIWGGAWALTVCWSEDSTRPSLACGTPRRGWCALGLIHSHRIPGLPFHLRADLMASPRERQRGAGHWKSLRQTGRGKSGGGERRSETARGEGLRDVSKTQRKNWGPSGERQGFQRAGLVPGEMGRLMGPSRSLGVLPKSGSRKQRKRKMTAGESEYKSAN